MTKNYIKEINANTRDQMEMILTESLNAVNELSRHGGFAPVQWVIGKLPRTPASTVNEEENMDIGAMQGHIDGQVEYGIQSLYRQKAREAFVRYDSGIRKKRALRRKAAPVTGEYQVGDIVSYCRNARKGESGLQWSVGSRFVGFEGLTCWVMRWYSSMCC